MRAHARTKGQWCITEFLSLVLVRCATTLCVADLASACASARTGAHHETAPPNIVMRVLDSLPPADAIVAPAIVRVINGTAQPFRVQIAYGGSLHTLGSVSGLETREFAIARRDIVGYYQFRLLATMRDNRAEPHESEPFALNGANMVEWQVDARRLRSVTLR